MAKSKLYGDPNIVRSLEGSHKGSIVTHKSPPNTQINPTAGKTLHDFAIEMMTHANAKNAGSSMVSNLNKPAAEFAIEADEGEVDTGGTVGGPGGLSE